MNNKSTIFIVSCHNDPKLNKYVYFSDVKTLVISLIADAIHNLNPIVPSWRRCENKQSNFQNYNFTF